MSKEGPELDNAETCAELQADEGWKSASESRPTSMTSEPEKRWIDVITGKLNIEVLLSLY